MLAILQVTVIVRESRATMTITGESSLDLRVRRTRRLLQQAFEELMREKSFKALTVQDITERAMVNRATFYDHFDDKYALLDYSIQHRFKQALGETLPGTMTLGVTSVRLLLITMCEFMNHVNGGCTPVDKQLLPLFETQMRSLAGDLLRTWLREAHHRLPELTAMVASWAMYGAATDWSQQEAREPAEDYVSRVLPMVLGIVGLQSV
jgi:AcrR family transcriptional regulator